jgi:hypothetical protein
MSCFWDSGKGRLGSEHVSDALRRRRRARKFKDSIGGRRELEG